MPRIARVAPGGMIYHVFNHAAAKQRIFRKESDYQEFYDVVLAAQERYPVRILGWCVMPDHWHLVVWPKKEGDLSRFFGYLTLTHAARWQVAHHAVGKGRVYQSRFKSFMIQKGASLATVMRFVESNPVRSGLVRKAQAWPWSSLHAKLGAASPMQEQLADWPSDRPRNWPDRVNRPLTEAEIALVRTAIARGRPLGDESWVKSTVSKFGLESTVRPRGRQRGWRKQKKGKK